MTTIADMVIAARVDPAGIRSGLREGGDLFGTFARAVETALDALPKGANTSGRAIAQAVRTAADEEFRRMRALDTEQVMNGLLSRKEFEARGKQLAVAFNASLSAGMRQIQDPDILHSGQLLQNLELLSSKMKREGLKAGEEYAASMSQGIQRRLPNVGAMSGMLAATQGGAGWPGRGPGFQVGGRNAGPAVTALAFGFESLARSATASEGAVRAASRSVATFAMGFGAGGLLITALIAGGTALWEFFTRARNEAEKTTEEFKKHLAEMANAGNAGDLQTQARKLYFGTPYNDKGQAMAVSSRVKGAFSGSIADLRAQRQELQALIDSAPNMLVASAYAGRMKKLDAVLRPLEQQLLNVQAAAENVASQPADNAGQLNKITINAKGTKSEWTDHITALRSVIDSYKLLEGEHQVTTRSGRALLSVYAQVNGELSRMSDLTSKHAVDLLKLRKEAESTNMLQALTGPLPGVQQTRGGAAALAGDPKDAIATTNTLLDRMRLLTDAGMVATSEWQRTVGALRILDGFLQDQNAREGITNERLGAQLNLRRAMNAENARTILQMPQLQDPGIRAQAGRVQRAGVIATGARAAGASNAGELEDAANAARTRAVATIRNMVEQLGSRNDLDATELDQLASMVALLDQMGAGVKRNADGWKGIVTGLRGVLDAASGLGKIPRDLADAVNAADHLVASLKQAQDAKTAAQKEGGGGLANVGNMLSMAGGVVGAIGAGISLVSSLSSLFGKNDESLKRNTEALDKLRMSTVLDPGLAGKATTLQVINQWAAARGGFGGRSGSDNSGLDQQLQAAGISVEQFQKMAKDLGIEFGKGVAWVESFAQALQIAITASKRFSASFEDQSAIRALHDKVFGKTSDADALARELGLLAQFAPKLGAAFVGLDTTTEDGRARIQKALQALTLMLEQNTIPPDAFGGLEGAKQLADIISSVQDDLAQLGNATADATAAMLGVPAGYRTALARFYASDPELPGTGNPYSGAGGGNPVTVQPIPVPQGPNDRTPWTPIGQPLLSASAAGGGAAGAAQSGGATFVFTEGSVVVQAQDMAPDDIFDAVLRAGQRRAATKFNDPTKWSLVQK